MTLWQSIVLGIVQGLTEFLPISSTAHLRIVPALLHWEDPGAAFTAVIQLGTLMAVLLYFARDIFTIVQAMCAQIFGGGRKLHSQAAREERETNARLGWMIGIGTIPVVVLGLLLKKHIEHSFRSLYVIAGAMIGLAVVLALAEWYSKRRVSLRDMKSLNWMDSIVVGLSQACALIPGSSRSGCTITGALFRGLNRETAARFSFLLSLPAVFAAGAYELIKERHDLLSNHAHVTNLMMATAVSFVVGYASIAFLLGYLKKHTTWLFIIYRLIGGAALLWLLSQGSLKP